MPNYEYLQYKASHVPVMLDSSYVFPSMFMYITATVYVQVCNQVF